MYQDFGPAKIRHNGHGELSNPKFRNRPHCELCGPFRGRYLRRAGSDEFGTLWRCERCDNED